MSTSTKKKKERYKTQVVNIMNTLTILGRRSNGMQIILHALLSCFVGLCFISHSSAQSVDRAKVVVSYTYNFAKHIEWPQENKLKSFKIALFQVDNKNLSDEFLKLNNSTSIKSVPIRIKKTNSINSLTNYNMVFVGTTDSNIITKIQALIKDKPILLVTSNMTNKRLVMINLFETQNQELKFEVNKANIINNDLNPLPELILLGGTEIDVAKLYRQGQSSLVNLQNQLASQQSKLEDLRQKSNTQKKTNDRLVSQMRTLNTDVKKIQNLNTALTKELKTLSATIEDSKKLINEQKTEIANSEKQKNNLIKQVDQRNQELDQKQKELKTQQQKLAEISLSITNKQSRLSRLNLTIDQQQEALEKQHESITQLDKLVSTQKQSLYFLWGLVGVGTALFFVSIFAYRSKRRDNERLARRSYQLQIARDKLEVAKRKAEAANRAKGAFLSLMSHELRTPLQSIIGYTDLVIEDLKAEGNDIYSDQLIRVNTNGERLLELINNTLDLAKIEAGKMSVQLTPTNIGSLVDEAVSNVKPLLTKNENELSVKIDNNTYTPNIDYDKLLHMLVNLLSNATKFTKKGNITIQINNTPKLLTVSVKDTGIGLSKEQLDKIFTQFHQANNGESRKFKGTGLGLSITQHFCELMGGDIDVDSQEGTGTTFSIKIPLPVVITEKKFIGIDIDDLKTAVA